jgi:biotin carboxyl carrier protein
MQGYIDARAEYARLRFTLDNLTAQGNAMRDVLKTHAGRLALAGFVMSLAIGCQKPAEAPANPARKDDWKQEIRVEPVTVERVPRDEVVAPGKVELDPNRIARIMLPLPGRITEVRVRVGDAVRAGQPLVTLESPDVAEAIGALRQAEANLVQARAGLAQAEAALAKAEQDAERAKDLYEHRAIAQKEVLAADNVVVQSRAAVEQPAPSWRRPKPAGNRCGGGSKPLGWMTADANSALPSAPRSTARSLNSPWFLASTAPIRPCR